MASPSDPEAQPRLQGQVKGENEALGRGQADHERVASSQVVEDDGDGQTTVGGPGFGEIRLGGVGSKQDLDVTALGSTVQCLRQDADEALG